MSDTQKLYDEAVAAPEPTSPRDGATPDRAESVVESNASNYGASAVAPVLAPAPERGRSADAT
ncbi:MAG: hypothetical protein NVS2B3_11560 [Vulcanimicrobiaceae bacterium]